MRGCTESGEPQTPNPASSRREISEGIAPADRKPVPPAVALFRRTHSACLRQKELQMQRLRDEIEALRRAADLLEPGKSQAVKLSQGSRRRENKGWV